MADFRRKKVIVFDELRGNVETEQQTRPISRIPFFFFFAPPPLELLDCRPSEGGPLVDAEASWTEQSA